MINRISNYKFIAFLTTTKYLGGKKIKVLAHNCRKNHPQKNKKSKI